MGPIYKKFQYFQNKTYLVGWYTVKLICETDLSYLNFVTKKYNTRWTLSLKKI